MKESTIKEFELCVKKTKDLYTYLEKYLKKDIKQIIDDYELDIDRLSDEEEPHVTGISYIEYNDIIVVTISFFDECSETGIGIEEVRVNLTEFLEWLKHKR